MSVDPTGATRTSLANVSARQPVGSTVHDLLRRRTELPGGHPDRTTLRTRGIEAGLPLARRLAADHLGHGEPMDDLYQVAALALVQAVDGYNPARKVAFTSYAVPTIVGALQRYLRDSTWVLRVPRGVKELAVTLDSTRARLTQELGRSPTPRELAACLQTTEHRVTVALNSWPARFPASLDAQVTTAEAERRPLIDTIGETDVNIDKVIDLRALQPLVATLTVRQQRILAMRFIHNMHQSEIAAQIGVSQTHVSRLLGRTLAQLRTGMLGHQA